MGKYTIRLFSFFKSLESKIHHFYFKKLKAGYTNLKLKMKIRNLLKLKPRKSLSNDHKREIKAFYSEKKFGKVSTLWHKYFTDCNGIFSAKYVPENIYYIHLEPLLNGNFDKRILADKNLLEKLFFGVKQPETVVKNINGFFLKGNKIISFDEALKECLINENLILKPTIETWGGKDVVLVKKDDGNNLEIVLERLFIKYEKDFIVQRQVLQHESMAILNSSSINTLRVMSFLNKSNEVQILSSLVRMGKKGSVTDNVAGGGFVCGINTYGKLNNVGYNKEGEKFYSNSSGLKFESVSIPLAPKVFNTAKILHQQIPYFRLISWDLSLDQNGDVVLIEYNVFGQGINMHQLNNGAVLANIFE
ncbi:sugar-transfer associated ATP-grasp domain-containing protein [Euzebyella saccharophila]|uniref:Sugar-transfer associated ATP-grasp domain-containing protein n=1 Tax=Euzebyella saccharophila TaxID=679664 RepID=A0ABV8JUL8_9FLAO|nr:sugar-transfer associated ATP-grasp domain-containing protein [Euzebyella saccharophila]